MGNGRKRNMVKKIFTPKKGDIIRLSFDPQADHEQSGWRPGLVISNSTFNLATGFCVVCPITNTDRGYPFHVPVKNVPKISGVIMVDQVKSLDYISKKASLISKADPDIMEEVMAIYFAIISDDV